MNKAYTYLNKAFTQHYAMGAFNTANLESLKAITQAASNFKAPILIEASHGEITYFGMQQLVKLVRTYEEELQIPIILNLDHGSDIELIKKAVDSGFDYVHIDCGAKPFDEAVKITKEVVAYAHKAGTPVEGEIDHIEGSSADHTSQKPTDLYSAKSLTDPKRAAEFVKATQIDTFASFVGNLHGIYSETKHLHLDILREIHELLPDTFLSLHGGSGIFEDDVREALKLGIVKVNVNSEMRIAFKMTLQEVLNSSNEIAVYKLMEKPIEAVRKVVEAKIGLFGCGGKV